MKKIFTGYREHEREVYQRSIEWLEKEMPDHDESDYLNEEMVIIVEVIKPKK